MARAGMRRTYDLHLNAQEATDTLYALEATIGGLNTDLESGEVISQRESLERYRGVLTDVALALKDALSER